MKSLVTSIFSSSLSSSNYSTGNSQPFNAKYSVQQRQKKRKQLLDKCGTSQDSVVCVAVSKGANSKQISEWNRSAYMYLKLLL